MLVGGELRIGFVMKMGPATKYEHVFTVSVIGILHLKKKKKKAKNLQISLSAISASSPMVSH